MDYPSGLHTGMHGHPKAQLIYGISGVMRVETENAFFVLPPTKALFLPPDEMHSITMEGDVAMRELFIDRALAEKVAPEARVLAVGPLLRVAQAIIDNPADARSLEDWAEICGASDRTLARLFLRETGMTFGQWRLQARLNAAFILLMTEGDIPRVAQKVGFSSHSAFGVAFRRTFGLTPAQARTLHLGSRD